VYSREFVIIILCLQSQLAWNLKGKQIRAVYVFPVFGCPQLGDNRIEIRNGHRSIRDGTVGFLSAEYEETRKKPRTSKKWDTFRKYHEEIDGHIGEKQQTKPYLWSLPPVHQFLNNKKFAVEDGFPGFKISKSCCSFLPVEIWVPIAAEWKLEQEQQKKPPTLCRFEEHISGAYAVEADSFRCGLQGCCNNQKKREFIQMISADNLSLRRQNEAQKKRIRALKTELRTCQKSYSELKKQYALVASVTGQGQRSNLSGSGNSHSPSTVAMGMLFPDYPFPDGALSSHGDHSSAAANLNPGRSATGKQSALNSHDSWASRLLVGAGSLNHDASMAHASVGSWNSAPIPNHIEMPPPPANLQATTSGITVDDIFAGTDWTQFRMQLD